MVYELTVSTKRLRALLAQANIALSDEAVLRITADPDHFKIGLAVVSDDHPSLGQVRTLAPGDGYL